MAIYKIADIIIDIVAITEYTKRHLLPYKCSEQPADMKINLSLEDIDKEISLSGVYDKSICEFTAIFRKLCHKATNEFNTIFLHSSAIEYDGKAYLFLALPGTGKTTHTLMWKKAFNDNMKIINGDKPLLRNIDGKIYVYGTPWQGKEDFGENTKAELGGIFILKRGKKNRVSKISAIEAFPHIINATLKPEDKYEAYKLLDFLNDIYSKAFIYQLECNISTESAYVAKNAIVNGVTNDN